MYWLIDLLLSDVRGIAPPSFFLSNNFQCDQMLIKNVAHLHPKVDQKVAIVISLKEKFFNLAQTIVWPTLQNNFIATAFKNSPIW